MIPKITMETDEIKATYRVSQELYNKVSSILLNSKELRKED